jgi:hypothetical protein
MMFANSVCFAREKSGSAALEWEDGAAAFDGDRGRNPRYVVVDGATEAYDSLRWVEQLVTTFAGNGTGAPALTAEGLRSWLGLVQRQWAEQSPSRFANVIEEYKFREGSFATFLGVELTGIRDRVPRWRAVALGDTVLFHVRAGRLLGHFPPIEVDEFGLVPDGVHTDPAVMDQMSGRLLFGQGELADGDLLYAATDAFAHWMLGRRDQPALWTLLAALDHDELFGALVTDQRAAGALRNDDVTLLRVRITATEPACLVVCL